MTLFPLFSLMYGFLSFKNHPLFLDLSSQVDVNGLTFKCLALFCGKELLEKKDVFLTLKVRAISSSVSLLCHCLGCWLHSSVTCWFSWKPHFRVLLKTIVFAFEREDCPPTGWLNLLFFHMKNALRFSREKSHYLTFSTLFIWKRSLFWPLKEFTFNRISVFFH